MARDRKGAAIADSDRARLEYQVLALQSAIAALFVGGALAGWAGQDRGAVLAAAGWITFYHFAHAWYVVRRRVPGRPIGAVEMVTPLLDVSCVTMAWVALGDPQSPFWGVYLYALVGYGRRFHGRAYFGLAVYIVVNVFAGRAAIAAGNGGTAILDADLMTMIVLAAATASLSHAVGTGWRQAERNARLLAETDPLTGIANRRHFLDRFEAMGAGPQSAFAVLMLDLDDFKRLNDEFGHIHGDQVLTRVAQLLAANVRPGDQVARYGGEEFVVAMPGADLSQALAVADRLRHEVMATTPTSVSVGCAVRAVGESPAGVLQRADAMLLAAKRTGKNTIRWSELRKTA